MSTTSILQPIFFSNSRVEFRLDGSNKVLSANLRLSNFGSVPVPGAGDPDPLYYIGSGVYGLIKQITLYSNGVIIDEVKDANRWLSISALVNSTANAWDTTQKLLCNGLNLQHQEALSSAQLLTLRPQTPKYVGMIYLNNIFPMLKAVNGWLIDFKDLRVVIEYNTDVASVFQALGNGPVRPASFTPTQPVMLYDELLDDELLAEKLATKTMTWEYAAIQREAINIAASVADTADSTVVRLRSMDGHLVDKVLLQVVGAGVIHPLLGYGYSANAFGNGDSINLVLNSQRLLPQNGLNTPARKSAALFDSLPDGNMQIFTMSNDILSTTGDVGTNVFDAASTKLLLNTLAFTSVDIKTVVNQLDIEYTRKANANAMPAYQIWIWSRCMTYGIKNPDGSIQVLSSKVRKA